jgi:hypothetical protein
VSKPIDRLPKGEYGPVEDTPPQMVGHLNGVAIGESPTTGALRILLCVHPPHGGPCDVVDDRLVELDPVDVAEILDVAAQIRQAESRRLTN